MFNQKPGLITSASTLKQLKHQTATEEMSPTSQQLAALNHPQQLVSKLTDQQLLDQCQHYGSQAKLWKQRFLGLLPEVDRRKLYLQQGCSSVFEFASKLGGVSREQVISTQIRQEV